MALGLRVKVVLFVPLFLLVGYSLIALSIPQFRPTRLPFTKHINRPRPYSPPQRIPHTPAPSTLSSTNSSHADFLKELVDSYQNMDVSSQNVKIGYIDDLRGWFEFFTDPYWTSFCNMGCQYVQAPPHAILNDASYDAVLSHQTTPEARLDKGAAANKELLYIAVRNEPDLITLAHQWDAQHSVDISIGWHRNATLWGNYCYWVIEGEEWTLPELPHREYNAACAVISNCGGNGIGDAEERIKYVQELNKHVPVRLYGHCAWDAALKKVADKAAEIAKCKFYLAFENRMAEDYITEKFFDGFRAGTVPVVRGSRDIGRYAPAERSMIVATDYESPEALGKYLQSLLDDEAKYSEYLAWRQTGTPLDYSPAFRGLNNHTVIRSPCKACRAVAEMRHARQLVTRVVAKSRGEPAPSASARFISQDEMQLALNALEVQSTERIWDELMELWDMAYGRLWRKDNSWTLWNQRWYTER